MHVEQVSVEPEHVWQGEEHSLHTPSTATCPLGQALMQRLFMSKTRPSLHEVHVLTFPTQDLQLGSQVSHNPVA